MFFQTLSWTDSIKPISLNDKAVLKESLHNQKLHRVLFVRVILLDYILGAFVKSRATWCPRGLGTAGLMSRDLYLGEADDVGALFIEYIKIWRVLQVWVKHNSPVFEVQHDKYSKISYDQKCVFSVSSATVLHQVLLSVLLDTNQEISEYYLFVQKILLWYGDKGDKLKPWLAQKMYKTFMKVWQLLSLWIIYRFHFR